MLFCLRLCCEHPNGEEVLTLGNTSQVIELKQRIPASS